MKSVEEIATEIVAREGGFVNDPDDPGGATKYGVTIHTMRRLGLDLDRDGQVTSSDVNALTRDQARDIFLKHYFQKPRLAELPHPLQASVFDMYVNAGSNAVRVLQQLFAKMGYELAIDGKLGPQTLGVARAAMKAAPEHLVDAYGIERRNYYYRLADRRPKSRKYAKRRDGGKGGWIARAEAFLSAKYHFSDQDHHERTAAWG
ncbi:peptidoglycan-binding protein [Aliiroseovarius sp. M344]|uniref:holin-associated N-acetylmuramidase n=1 Tax=Aliiroseovarius sp. M344 TaxID=2867010 RepID=UPI0021ADEAD8|nr:holin-associated N-acetylmuramidase [Aliiroseovarius sp. M344]UWQ13442.1 peptidoglycan-binding protein [Aliiroseovarius sp. M344]